MKLTKGNKVEAKIKNRWREVTIKRVNKNTISVEYDNDVVLLKPAQIREISTPKKTLKKQVSIDTSSNKQTSKPGTRNNPWIPLSDLRSHNLISTLSYEDKVKFEHIIVSLIKDLQ